MSDANPVTLPVETWWEDEPTRCKRCGLMIAKGREFAWRPEPHMGRNALASVHTHCAVVDGYRLGWPHDNRERWMAQVAAADLVGRMNRAGLDMTYDKLVTEALTSFVDACVPELEQAEKALGVEPS